MIREVIFFEVKLGHDSDRFRELFRKVRDNMEAAGVEPGSVWSNLSGTGRCIIVEREFASLAQYEQDDAAFHGDKELMTNWRQMEECLVSMRVDLWKQLRPRSRPAAE